MKIDDDSNSSPTLRGKVYKKALASKTENVLATSSAVYNKIRLNQSLNNSLKTDPNESISKKSNRLSHKSGYQSLQAFRA